MCSNGKCRYFLIKFHFFISLTYIKLNAGVLSQSLDKSEPLKEEKAGKAFIWTIRRIEVTNQICEKLIGISNIMKLNTICYFYCRSKNRTEKEQAIKNVIQKQEYFSNKR